MYIQVCVYIYIYIYIHKYTYIRMRTGDPMTCYCCVQKTYKNKAFRARAFLKLHISIQKKHVKTTEKLKKSLRFFKHLM